jgi:RNA polymerase sigma-70 factor (ECF subfamily)
MTTFAEHPAADTSDGILARAYLAGDDEAFNTLYRLHHPRIVRALFARVHDRTIAEDLAQEAMLRSLQYLHRYDPTLPFWPWVKRIAFNLIPAEMARRSAEVPVDEADRTITLPDTTDGVVSRDEVLACLRQLPKRQSRALIMRYVEDRDANDIAVLFDLNRNALEQLLLRARGNFRKGYGPRNGAVVPVGLAGVAARLRRLVDGVAARIQLVGGVTMSTAGDFALGAITVGGIGLATMGHLPGHPGEHHQHRHAAAAPVAVPWAGDGSPTRVYDAALYNGSRGYGDLPTGQVPGYGGNMHGPTAVQPPVGTPGDDGAGAGDDSAVSTAAPNAPNTDGSGTQEQAGIWVGPTPTPQPGAANPPVNKPTVIIDPPAPTPESTFWVNDEGAGGGVQATQGPADSSGDVGAKKNVFGEGEVVSDNVALVVNDVTVYSGSGGVENSGDGGLVCDVTSVC